MTSNDGVRFGIRLMESNVDLFAEEGERQGGGGGGVTEHEHPLVVVDAEQGQGEVPYLVAAAGPGRRALAESGQHRPDAHHVQPAVAAERRDHRPDAVWLRGGAAEAAHVFP
ncbi:unnamed protein product [Cuscuta epithymum]|uniref:Uncharacterized protein n=1 Tax=Cuscuta epithymum TaxID=186058 RepID=A0AAV0FNV4_9ASTE|nr:unnamed protein product [Cuscuta epithymum]